MSSLRDMNLAKLVPADVPVFLSILGDIFPSVISQPARVASGLREALVNVALKSKVSGRCTDESAPCPMNPTHTTQPWAPILPTRRG